MVLCATHVRRCMCVSRAYPSCTCNRSTCEWRCTVAQDSVQSSHADCVLFACLHVRGPLCRPRADSGQHDIRWTVRWTAAVRFEYCSTGGGQHWHDTCSGSRAVATLCRRWYLFALTIAVVCHLHVCYCSVTGMSLNFADLLSTPGAASLFDTSTQASSLSHYDTSQHVDLSLVDFDYLAHCTNPATLQSVIRQLEHEPYPDLLQAARHRLLQVDEGAREAVERRRREGEEKQAMVSELEQWTAQQKHKEQQATSALPLTASRKLPPIRSSQPATTEPAQPLAVEGAMSEEERARRVASEKLKGNECYKAGEYATAAEHYSAAIALLPPPYNAASTTVHPTSFASSSSAAPPSTGATYDFSLHTNLCMALLRLGRYQQAVNTASAALTHSHGAAVKAWWRRAQAYQQLNKHAEALRDYSEGIKRADNEKVRDEMERDMQRLQADVAAKGRKAREEEEEKRQVEEERKEKARADTVATSSEKLKRMTIVEDDSDEAEEEEQVASADRKPSSQPVFQAPRGGMTIEVLK